MSFTRAKHASIKCKCTVFGYVRRHCVSESITVPVLVQYLCLHYYWLEEQFRPLTGSKSVLALTENGTLITNQCKEDPISAANWMYQIVGGSIRINNDEEGISEYEWRFVISALAGIKVPSSALSVGIGSCEGDLCCIAFFDGKISKVMQRGDDVSEAEEFELKRGDKVWMKLNVEQRTLHFNLKRNGTELWKGSIGGVPLDKICFLVVTVGKGLSIRIDDFCIQQNGTMERSKVNNARLE